MTDHMKSTNNIYERLRMVLRTAGENGSGTLSSNSLCADLSDLCRRAEANERLRSDLANWCQTFGVDLCPRYGDADTFGNGMRRAKEHVRQIVGAAPSQEPKETAVTTDKPYNPFDGLESIRQIVNQVGFEMNAGYLSPENQRICDLAVTSICRVRAEVEASQVCCNDWDACKRPCVARGRHQASAEIAELRAQLEVERGWRCDMQKLCSEHMASAVRAVAMRDEARAKLAASEADAKRVAVEELRKVYAIVDHKSSSWGTRVDIEEHLAERIAALTAPAEPATPEPCCLKHGNWGPFGPDRMVLCRTCGHKRCPKASDCALACTDSNEPGQPGSDYGKVGRPVPDTARADGDKELREALAKVVNANAQVMEDPHVAHTLDCMMELFEELVRRALEGK